jgi:hypothetical protein
MARRGISDGALAPRVLGALDAKGSQHVHNVAAARQRLDPEQANVLSVPHHGQATVNRPTVVLEATTGVFTAGPSFLPRPNYVPCPNPSDTCPAGTPIFVL